MTEEIKTGEAEEESRQTNMFGKSVGDSQKDCQKKIKNYTSIIILLTGLLIGSIFVDVAQFFSQSGFSPRALRETSVVPFDGKTWVAYNEPVVELQIVNDSQCEECAVEEPLQILKRVIPTLVPKSVQYDSEQGRALVEQLEIKSLPAFAFGENVTKTDVYSQAQEIFMEKDGFFLLNAEQIGVRPGRFISLPDIQENDSRIGNEESQVRVILFTDFECPFCKSFYEQGFGEAIDEYQDRVLFVFKHLPLQIHKKAEVSALASECAAEQGKFWQMADKLYASQKEWSEAVSNNIFKNYAASLGLNVLEFNQCFDSNEYGDEIQADAAQAEEFGISGTPATFVNGQFMSGVVPYETLKAAIDEELGK